MFTQQQRLGFIALELMPGYHQVLELHLKDGNGATNVLVSQQMVSTDSKKMQQHQIR